MSRRPSWVMGGAATTRVNRTPSGLPLCSTCHKELGFCSHTPIFRDRPRGMNIDETEGSTALSAAAAGNGASVRDVDTVPSALSIDASSRSGEGNQLEDYLRQGTKRRRSAALEGTLGKSKRRGMLTQPKNTQGGDSAATARGKRGSKKSSIRATRNLRRSARFAEEAEPAAAKRTSFASSCSGGGSSGGGGVTDEEKKQLLRFRGFEANDAGKECICCYQVANITVNFMCEERREKAAREAQAASQREQQSATESSRAGAGPVTSMGGLAVEVPHVMCVDCFRVFVESRVSDRKLVTSREFDGYTVGCPMGCADSFIDPACFEEIMGAAFMVKYRRFSAIHLASHMRIVWCPACHCGVVPSAAAAAAARRPSVVPAPEVQLPRQGSNSFLWGLWGGRGGAGAVEGDQGELPPRRRPSLCIGCPGCQASLCLSCRALHAPGVDCTAAAAAADIANAADANGGVWEVTARRGEAEGGGGGGSAGSGSEATRRASAEPQAERFEEEPPTTTTKRCPSCHVPIFKDGGCNHMQCSMCQFEFCWLHLTEWVVGGECQRGHWSSNPALNRAYNAQRVARERQNCTVS